MNALAKSLRKDLAAITLQARQASEKAARAALENVAVHEKIYRGHMNSEQKELRNRLRALGRSLGDERDRASGKQDLPRLTEYVAYEHWHRMIFTRFLAENNLLITDDENGNVPVTLAECDELAPDLKARDGFELACRFAAKMLPQLFRSNDPALEVKLALNDVVTLKKLLDDLPAEVFTADDSLGWVYQFWQAERKDDVNESGDKIGADELPAVTQLFTEDYMVLFLLHNTLGAWWAARQLDNIQFRKPLASEAEAREVVALPGVKWEYLRFIRDDGNEKSPPPNSAHWRPAAGNFAGWPKTAKELRVLDPCMGSGHFAVFELPILVAMRMAEERLSKAEACEAVLRDNLFGLEIDPRCTQLAAFNLALAAWKLGGYRKLPALNLACCGLRIASTRDDWLKLVPRDQKFVMGQLYDLFKHAPDLGSLIDPRRQVREMVGGNELEKLLPVLDEKLRQEGATEHFEEFEEGVTARGLAHAAEILAGQFTLVATNVPYLGRGKQDEVLMEFCESHHPDAKADLATCFVERCLNFSCIGGNFALVTPQTWFFQAGYKTFRKNLLTNTSWDFVARLGEHGFDSPQAAGAFATLFSITHGTPEQAKRFMGIDASGEDSPLAKAQLLAKGELTYASQIQQLNNPDARIVLESVEHSARLSDYAISVEGMSTGDSERYLALFWEVSTFENTWDYFQRSPDTEGEYSGARAIVRWENGKGTLAVSPEARIQGHGAWGKRGVLVNMMRHLNLCLSVGAKHDKITAVIVPNKDSWLLPIWTFCSSGDFFNEVRKLNPALQPGTGTLVKVPFDLAHWQKVAAEKYPHGLPKPHSDDPTQWLFNGHPKGSTAPLQVAVARLLGYRWPRQTGSSFPDCPALKPDGLEKLADEDGIVCLPPLRREQPAANRLRALLAEAYGREWSAAKERELIAATGSDKTTLEEWLRDDFFAQHCNLFHNRPFIWHVWDGRKDGFHVLLNYHRLDHEVLKKVAYTYLGDWIRQQQDDAKADKPGAAERLGAARSLQKELDNILKGEAPYDIFVRWKPLEKQPKGWHPDLNDGVRLNIRPFMTAPDVGKKGAGILRTKPNIHWNKDRGKDVASAPWYKKFKGDRINDHHLTLEEKRKA